MAKVKTNRQPAKANEYPMDQESAKPVEQEVVEQHPLLDEEQELAKKQAEEWKKEIAQKLALIEEEKEQIKQEKLQLADQRSQLAKKEREISEREVNAEREFFLQNEESLDSFNKRKESLNQEILKKEQELEQKIMDKEKELSKLNDKYSQIGLNKQLEVDKQVEKYRQNKLKQIEAEYNEQRAELLKQVDLYKKSVEERLKLREDELLAREKELAKKEKEIQKIHDKLEKQIEELNDQKLVLIMKEKELDFQQRMLDQDEQIFHKRVEEKVQDKVKETAQRLVDKTESEQFLIKKLSLLERQISEYEKVDLQSGNRSKQDLLTQIEQQKEEILRLKKELRDRPDQDVYIELEEKSKRYQSLVDQNKELMTTNSALEQQQHTWLMSVGELEFQKEQKELEMKRREAIMAQVAEYKKEVERLKSIVEKPQERDKRVEVIENPRFTRIEETFEDIDEISWLEQIIEKARDSGLKFNRRLLYSFHTSLKTAEWSPLTVLAGVSGTGKSELPRNYSRFGGLYYLSLPVQPDWDSPQSLFGYFNSIDNRFNATPLLRAMVQFQQQDPGHPLEDNLSDRLFLVLLDEMNLAHVELYFSDLLSKLEERRGLKEAVNIEIDLGADMDKYAVELSRNILWVGTMNEDETTKSLSDKVIDRGNLLSFPRPTTFERRKELTLVDRSPDLNKKIWDQWLDSRVDFDQELDKYKIKLEEINEYLEFVGRAIGHRVWQAIESYISNHPLVTFVKNNESEGKEELDKMIGLAFEEALVHKVMPKLRGIERSGKSKSRCLEPIQKVIDEIAPGLSEDFKIAMDSDTGEFVWKSAKYLENYVGE